MDLSEISVPQYRFHTPILPTSHSSWSPLNRNTHNCQRAQMCLYFWWSIHLRMRNCNNHNKPTQYMQFPIFVLRSTPTWPFIHSSSSRQRGHMISNWDWGEPRESPVECWCASSSHFIMHAAGKNVCVGFMSQSGPVKPFKIWALD